MIAKIRKTGLAVLAMVIICNGVVFADTAATVAVTPLSSPNAQAANTSIGWRFHVNKEMTVTDLGLFDQSGDGIQSPHLMGIWRVNDVGLTLLTPPEGIPIGGTSIDENGVTVLINQGPVIDGHRYVSLGVPVQLSPEPLMPDGSSRRYVVGVWTSSINYDGLIMPPDIATITMTADITLQNYLARSVSGFDYPWSPTSESHMGVNFKYRLPGPTAEAGANDEISTSEQAVTTISGSATHTVAGTAMQYQWFEGEIPLSDLADVGPAGEAPLSLASPVPALSLGDHTLRLDVTDGWFTSSDTMTLTVTNTPPVVQLAPETQNLEIYVDAIIVTAEVADFDGEPLTYEWFVNGDSAEESGTTPTPAGGAAVVLPDLALDARDPRFNIGDNTVDLVVSDGVNASVTASVTVTMEDTRRPTLCPVPSRIMLWPPDGQLKPVTIWANAFDRGGGPTTLSVLVESSRPPAAGETDYYIDSINNETDTIKLRLRAERRIPGLGRIYRITVTATDQGGNSSSAILLILAPRHGFCF